MRPGALGREARGELDGLARLAAGDDRDEDRAVLERDRRARAAPARAGRGRAGCRGGGGRARRRRSPQRARRSRRSASARPARRRRARRCRCRARRRSRRAASRCRRIRRFGRARHSSSSSRRFMRSATIDACAIVNESIAPNAYMRPRKSTWPDSRKIVGPIAPKTISASHGVFSFGCSRRKISGSWRWLDIAYVMRDAPITPAFVAMKRIVAARIPT